MAIRGLSKRKTTDASTLLAPSTMSELPEISWLAADDNPWGVPVLDVRPVTLGMLSTSADPQMASNAVSYGGEDGRAFAEQGPPVERSIDAALTFAIDRVLADGVLFTPSAMEDKWAVFVIDGRITCVRSWMRKVWLIADVRCDGETAVVGRIHGSFSDEDEEPALTVRLFDAFLRNHALDEAWPIPLPPGLDEEPKSAAMWCMRLFGRRALVATPHAVARTRPEAPLRTHSRLHIAVARGDLEAAGHELARGLPADLRAGDGLTTLQWAGSRDGVEIMAWLLEHGCPVDARSSEGSTALMTAVQGRKPAHVRWLLERGANPNARDDRGFTALHRAAEMGERECVELLLEHGATVHVEAMGHTPLSLARGQQQHEITALLAARAR